MIQIKMKTRKLKKKFNYIKIFESVIICFVFLNLDLKRLGLFNIFNGHIRNNFKIEYLFERFF